MPHIIRLREPWQRQRLHDDSLRFTRRFHRPTGLDEGSRVWLVIEDVEGEAEVALNEHVLGRLAGNRQLEENAMCTAHPTRFEMTQLLLPENVISIVIRPALAAKEAHASGFDFVRLEIEDDKAIESAR
jgi:hypothetical protein